MKRRIREGLAKAPWTYFFVFAVPFLIYWPYLSDWFFLLDDGINLQYAARYSPWQYFALPHIYQLFSPANLTPWLLFTYDFDYTLFGVHPLPFRIHQLASISIAAVLSFYLLRKYRVSRLPALMGVMLFLVSLPVINIADNIPARHYMEGLIFMLACLLFFLKAREKEQCHPVWWYGMSLLAYALSTLAKEVYVPFPLILFALSAGNPKQRLRRTLPFFFVTLLYLGYRFYMLGSFGGYTGKFGMDRYYQWQAYLSLLKVPLYAFRNAWIIWPLSAIGLTIFLTAAARKKINSWLVAGVVIALLVPFVGLLPQIMLYGNNSSPQWYMLVVWSVCMLVPIGAAIAGSKWLRVGTTCALALLVVIAFSSKTLPELGGHPTFGSKLAKSIWKSQPNSFLLSKRDTPFEISAPIWSYLAYIVKGKPGTFVAFGKDILHWMPQKGKKTENFMFGRAKRIPYPHVNIDWLSKAATRHMLSNMQIQNGVLHFDCKDGSKRVIYLIDKPFYASRMFTCSFYPHFNIKVKADRSGINTRKSYMILGVKTDGQWRYTHRIPYATWHPLILSNKGNMLPHE